MARGEVDRSGSDVAVPRRRVPSEPVAWLRAAVRSAVSHFELPADSPAAIFGSIAEGFGNAASDIDILIVTSSASHDTGTHTGLRQMLAFEARRVELCVRSEAELAAFAHDVLAAGAAGSALSSTDLDFFHRTAYALPISGAEVIERVQRAFDRRALAQLRSRRELAQVHACWQRARGLLALDRPLEAVGLAKQAARHAATAWACARGETYASRKFLFRQLERAELPAVVMAQLAAVLATPSTAAPDGVLAALGALVEDLGLPHLPAGPAIVRLAPEIRVLQLAKHHVIARDGTGSVVVGDEPVVAESLAAREAALPLASAHAAQVWGVLHRAGFAELALPGELWREPASLDSLPPLGELRVTSVGLTCTAPIATTRLGLHAVVRAGVELVTHAFAIENADEDATGALLRRDWHTLAAALWAMAYRSATVALCHEAAPAPPEHALIAALAARPHLRPIADALDRLAARTIHDAAGAAAYYQGVTQVTAALPAGVTRHFRGCHNSAVGWLKLLAYSLAPWARAARELAVAPPAEIEEMFAVALEPRLLTEEASEQLVGWRRELGIEQAFMRMCSEEDCRDEV